MPQSIITTALRLGIAVTRAMTDNSACKKAFAFPDDYEHLGLC